MPDDCVERRAPSIARRGSGSNVELRTLSDVPDVPDGSDASDKSSPDHPFFACESGPESKPSGWKAVAQALLYGSAMQHTRFSFVTFRRIATLGLVGGLVFGLASGPSLARAHEVAQVGGDVSSYAADLPDDASHPSEAGQRARLVWAAQGPGAGNLALGLYLSVFVIVPMYDLRAAYGLSDRASLQFRGAVGPMSWGGLGLRYALIRTEHLSIAAEASVTAGGIIKSGSSAGVDPKLLLSLGGDDVQVTLGVSPFIALSTTDARRGFQFVQVTAGLELATIKTASLAIQAGAVLAKEYPLPTLSIGATW